MESANLHPNAASRVTGELVLQNGHRAGTRQPLCAPTTFIGREQGCDIRLNVDGIDQLHCLLITGHDGVRIRDLNSAHGTFVNGVRTEHLQLQHDDILSIGPFQFRVELTATPATDDPERDALRIQIAAVAAQQTALDEEEVRLQKRKADLEQQEEQLAAHLAEKQRQVQISSEQIEEEREVLRVAKVEQETRVARIEAELAQAKEGLTKDHHHVTLERQRVNKIYHRLRQRWQKHWAVEKEHYQRLAHQLDADRKELEQKQAAWRERDTTFNQEAMRFNADREFCVRQMQDERADLKKDQDAWRKRRSLELAALNARQSDLDDAYAKLAQARQLLAQEKAAWERQQEMLEKELYGLNNRIVHHRIRLQEQADELAQLDARRRERLAAEAKSSIPEAILLECDVEILEEPPPPSPRLLGLDQLASDLADQRVALVEQYERIVQIHRSWHEERARAADELEALAQRLAAAEQDLVERQAHSHAGEESLRARQTEIDGLREEIAIHRAQLKTREQVMEDEHTKEMVALRQKETLLDEQLASLAQVRLRWNSRRQEEIDQVQASRDALVREQAEAQSQRTELFAAGQQIAEAKRALAEKTLALEQYRQEVFIRAKDPAAQKRVERLRRRWLSLHAALVRHATNEREAAQNDLERIDKSHTQLQEQLNRLTHGEAALTEKQALLDEREAVLKARQIHLEDEQRKLDHRKNEPERQNLLLRADAEAVAQVVFEKDAPPIDKAA